MGRFLDLVNKWSSLHDKLYGKKHKEHVSLANEHIHLNTYLDRGFVQDDSRPKIISDVVFDRMRPSIEMRQTPSPTSSILDLGCRVKEEPNTNIGESLPVLKHFLTKWYPFILDVTEINERHMRGNTKKMLEIHVSVSPIHAAELMNPIIERKVRNTIYKKLIPTLNSLFSEFDNDSPYVIFHSTNSETILQLI